MTMNKLKLLGCSTALISAIALPVQAQITYVDITDGPSGNTMCYTNGTWTVWNAFVGQTWVENDGVWDNRAFGNNGTIYQNAGYGQIDTNATRLRTTITVPEAPPGQYYNVYVLFWTDVSSWRVAASLTDEPGPLPLYLRDSPGVTQFYTGDDATVYSDSLSPNPFTSRVMIAEGNRRLLMTPSLGSVSGPTITVYMEPDRNQQDHNQRTWLDGIGYELVPEPSPFAFAGLALLIALFRFRAKR